MSKPNMLFISPPDIPIEEIRNTNTPTAQWATNISMKMGILSLAAYTLKHVDAQIRIIDLGLEISNNEDSFKTMIWEEFLRLTMSKVFDSELPEIVGISALYNSNAGYMELIASTAKVLWPGVLVIAGGILPTNYYRYVLDEAPSIDAIVIKEGEKPLVGLLTAGDKKEYLAGAKGWMTRERLHEEPTMDLINDLDEIPFFRYDLIDFDAYQKLNRYHGERSSDSIAVSVMTTRGCPYGCCFCASHTVHGKKIRRHSSERVLNDIHKLKELYKVNIILIEDDLFFIQKEYALEVLKGISKMNLTIEFPNGISIQHMDEEMVDALKTAGLKMATLAVESGSERVLNEIIHKPYKKLSRVKYVVSLLRERGIYVRAGFIIGFPGETMEEILETKRFMKETGFNWVQIFIATPLVGSELYDICKKNELLISDSLEKFHFGQSNIRLSHSTSEEFVNLRYLMNLEVNFVDNYDLRNGSPQVALIGFLDVINRVPNHAFAYYFASQCYEKMGKEDLCREYQAKYREIVLASSEWMGYTKHFNLPIGEMAEL
ncbi:MAG: B12-binding domain-containing radical SAM protein [Candidatus Omnitrophica bacterium]|nr:B12-binding domain-containing radical SAM protein [Candidatus Omnitrophota bacterium]